MAVSVRMPRLGTSLNPAMGVFAAAIALLIQVPVFAASPCAGEAVDLNADDPGPVLESPCAKLSPPCNILCQEAWSAESRAATLEETAAETRIKADMAKKRAVYFQNLADKKMLEAQREVKNRRWLWKTADSLLRLLVPRHSRKNDRVKSQGSISGIRKRKEKDAAEARERADEAMLTADETVEAAYKAGREAVAARAEAADARRSYEACACR